MPDTPSTFFDELYRMVVSEQPTREQRIEREVVARRNNAELRENTRRNDMRESRRSRGLRGGGEPVPFVPEAMPPADMAVDLSPGNVFRAGRRSANAASALLATFGPPAESLAQSVAGGLRQIWQAQQPVMPDPAVAPAAAPQPGAPSAPASGASPFALPAQAQEAAPSSAPPAPVTDDRGLPRARTLDEMLNELIYVDPAAAAAPGAVLPNGAQLSQGTQLSYAEPTTPGNLGQLEVTGPELRGGSAAALHKLRRTAASGDPEAAAAYQAYTAPLLAAEFKRVDTELANLEREAQQKVATANSDSVRMQAEAQLKNAETARMEHKVRARGQFVQAFSALLQQFGLGSDPSLSKLQADLLKQNAEANNRYLLDQRADSEKKLAELRKNLTMKDTEKARAIAEEERRLARIVEAMNAPSLMRSIPGVGSGAGDVDAIFDTSAFDAVTRK